MHLQVKCFLFLLQIMLLNTNPDRMGRKKSLINFRFAEMRYKKKKIWKNMLYSLNINLLIWVQNFPFNNTILLNFSSIQVWKTLFWKAAKPFVRSRLKDAKLGEKTNIDTQNGMKAVWTSRLRTMLPAGQILAAEYIYQSRTGPNNFAVYWKERGIWDGSSMFTFMDTCTFLCIIYLGN